MLSADRFRESRMRQTLTSGSTRGEEVGLPPRFPSYSTSLGPRLFVPASARWLG